MTPGPLLAEPNAATVALEQLQEFFRTFDQEVYRVMAGGRGAPSEARLEDFEKALDFQLPAEFREFTLSPLGGLSIEVREELWPRPKVGARASWKDQFGLNIFGLPVPVPESLDLREEIMKLVGPSTSPQPASGACRIIAIEGHV